jgi:hypothetical protein
MNKEEINKSFEKIKELSIFNEEIENEIYKIKNNLKMDASKYLPVSIGNLNVNRANEIIDIFNNQIEPLLDELENQRDSCFSGYQDETIEKLVDLLKDGNYFNHLFRWLYVSYVSLHNMVCSQESETLGLNSDISKALKIMETIKIFDEIESKKEND